ncbi:hypothetical protein NQ176_g8787 [Zarea fungicola]|uniref:Uncharacterized protein n=1 Tax=Zarea fungicola TaxID=93591 RepID=A0ACC1MRH2_9HYPO|nr:hypothetical protein NQ176_g8787 [Lecanicillium fungicola]
MVHTQISSQKFSRVGKRKRDASVAAELGVPPSAQAINPHSYPPAKLAQFAVAGLPEDSEDPCETIKDFPHRGLGQRPAERALESDYDTGQDDDCVGETLTEPKLTKSKRPPDTHERYLDVLVKSIHQFLGQGEISKAARALGLALQLRPHHDKVDVRRDDMWALGAEVIMREGEEQRLAQNMMHHGSGYAHGTKSPLRVGNESRVEPRWGTAANMDKLRAYFETLIQQYPYDYKSPKNVSALHFNISLYSCEIYNVYSEYIAGLASRHAAGIPDERLAEDESDLRLETLLEDESFQTPQEIQHSPKERLRLWSLEALNTVANRMDVLMRDMPYEKNHELLRLRAAASLFMADLLVPFENVMTAQLHHVDEHRCQEVATAKRALQMILQSGGELDEALQTLAESDDGDENISYESQILSVLPIRRA